jgi:RNA polymerase sigma-70 factor (ECF subfamily)
MVISDAAVIGRIRGGEPEAFALLVERYHTRCARLATRLLGDADDAADAVQDAFVRAYLSLDRYEERDRFSAWLLRILANRCHTMALAARRRAHVAGEWCRTYASDDVHEIEPGDHALADRIARALDTLPDGTRDIVVRKYAREWTYEELAADTGASVSALKMRVTRGSAQLRRVLAGAALTTVAALLVVATHRPHTEVRRSTTIACDTLRTLMHDTLSRSVRDSLLPPGRCGADTTFVAPPRHSLPARETTLEHTGL